MLPCYAIYFNNKQCWAGIRTAVEATIDGRIGNAPFAASLRVQIICVALVFHDDQGMVEPIVVAWNPFSDSGTSAIL